MTKQDIKDLFYSKKEQIAFWVAGYTDNSLNANDQIEMLKKHTSKFAEVTGVEQASVYTDFITVSRRYRSMRVFYANSNKPPVGSFELNDNWTMNNWLNS